MTAEKHSREKRMLMNPRIISIKNIHDEAEGDLSIFEGSGHDLPFAIKRIYYIHHVPVGTVRGGHAHKQLTQLLWCPYGSITILLDDGTDKAEVKLDTPTKGLIVEHAMWREMRWEQEGSVLCVAASEFYDESDYIRDYAAFQAYVKQQAKLP